MKAVAHKHYLEDNLVKEALDALQEKTGIAGRLVSTQQKTPRHDEADAIIEFTVDSQPLRYIVECKSAVDRKLLVSHVKAQLSNLPAPGLLIAPYVSREIAEYCRETKLQFIDTHGNAYLNAPGMFVYVTGEKKPAGRAVIRNARGTANPTALRITFALLCQPAIVQAPYREIMESAGVSLGAVSSSFDDLKRRGLLLDAARGRHRKLLESKRLFDEWVTNYPVVLRPKLNPRRFSAPDPDWWQSAQIDTFGAVWSGEVAAARITGYLKPATQMIYVAPASMTNCLKQLVSTHRLKPDPDGQIEILEKFWDLPADPKYPDIAPAILVYADLMAALEPRNSEAAKMIWETRIETAFAQT
ncbi:MAG: type IV toxin-antitoxin system AbiEi family antitoxin [Burkholderiaceae bacterium]